MKKVKKIPLRKCVVTGERFEKKQLLRIVRSPEGVVSVDLTGRANGRGAYVSKDLAAVEKARKTKILERHLEIQIPETVYDEMIRVIQSDAA
jgi:predicted RNA-binding protein YlxR (DUF448 family)